MPASPLRRLDGTVRPYLLNDGLVLQAGDSGTLLGTIINPATLAIEGQSIIGPVTLGISGAVGLTGGGQVVLNDLDGVGDSGSVIAGSSGADVLDNVDNLIAGFNGRIGNGTMRFVNDTGGSVIAYGGMLAIDTGRDAIVNAGSMGAATGTLALMSPVLNTGSIFVGASGTLVLGAAVSGNGSIYGDMGSKITLEGATLAGAGSFRTADRSTVSAQGASALDGRDGTLSFYGLRVKPGGTLTVTGTIENRSWLEIDGSVADGPAALRVAGMARLTGGGSVNAIEVTGAHENPNVVSITGSNTGDLLENVDNTISAFGRIGGAGLSIVNRAAGQIMASDGWLTLDAAGGGSIVNQGAIRAVGFGHMLITGAVDNTGGSIGVGTEGCGMVLHGATISGGQLQGWGDGIQIDAAGATLDGTQQAISTSGDVLVLAGGTLTLRGGISNLTRLTVSDNTADGSAAVDVSGTVTLTGGGTVRLTDSGAVITGGAGTNVLDNADNTITGSGQIGGGRLGFINEAAGSVRATAGTLMVDTGAARTINHCTMTADGGDLVFDSAVENTGDILARSGSVSFAHKVSGGNLQVMGGQRMVLAGGVDGDATLSFGGGGGTIVIGAGQPIAARINGLYDGDTLDLQGVSATSAYAGGVLTLRSGDSVIGKLTVTYAGETDRYATQDDGHGGTLIVHQHVDPPADAVRFTNVDTQTAGADVPSAYSGPVDYLQHEYIWTGADSVAVHVPVPNAFVKGGTGSDALAVSGGDNVLDGSAGSNLLIGTQGADGGNDVFFVDSRNGAVTWSTIVGFHQGDTATIFGFHPGVSTMPFTDEDGTPGFTGLTIHSEIDGPGTGVNSSLTFAGIDRGTAEPHFVFTSGMLPGDVDYLMIEYK